MALFGAPTAPEDDPERAVRAALAIRDFAVDLFADSGGTQARVRLTNRFGGNALTVGAAHVALGNSIPLSLFS